VSTPLALIVGLGNPGPEYHRTRHNAGADFVSALAAQCGVTLKPETRFHGLTARVQLAGQDVRLLVPTTWMNRSGQAVGPALNFFKLAPEQLLVAYDELDLPPGEVRFKFDGGHGGHNGLRDIMAQLGHGDFLRVRMGIGRPVRGGDVAGWVLQDFDANDAAALPDLLDRAGHAITALLTRGVAVAMNEINTKG
jgi:PTH1 family peptidyl-tRNA hydrolase